MLIIIKYNLYYEIKITNSTSLLVCCRIHKHIDLYNQIHWSSL